jgi:hypothetical protein
MSEIYSFLRSLGSPILSFFALGLLLGATQINAQNIPNAGSIQQQISRDREISIPKIVQGADLPKFDT